MSHNEPVPGLPGPLPPGEVVLWQGRPDWRGMALRAFHIRALALALAAFGFWTGLASLAARLPAGVALLVGLGPLIPGGFLLALVAAAAWLNARVSVYTITSRRVVMRIGLAFPLILNVPFAEVVDVSMAEFPDGAGDIPLGCRAGRRLGFLVLWPHARPWRWTRPEPMLRAVPHARAVAALLVDAMKAATAAPASGPAHATASGPRAAARQAAPRSASRPEEIAA